jgi:hypothetical protein
MCDFRNERGSVFTTKWKDASAFNLQKKRIPYYEVLSVNDHFVRKCLMVPENNLNPSKDMTEVKSTSSFQPETYHEVWPIKLWAEEF